MRNLDTERVTLLAFIQFICLFGSLEGIMRVCEEKPRGDVLIIGLVLVVNLVVTFSTVFNASHSMGWSYPVGLFRGRELESLRSAKGGNRCQD